MRIQLLSDLHLENKPGFVPTPLPGADVLVLAGDIGSYQRRSRLVDADFGLGRFARGLWPGAWEHILYLPGNHEFDALEFGPTRVRLRQVCERLGITWLDEEVLEISGVRFIGTTLWTDFESLARTAPDRDEALARAFRAGNAYLQRNTTLQDGEPVLAEGLREEGLRCRAWLRSALDRPFAGTTVVVTHFAPSLKSADPRYGLSPGTAGFCNDLDDWFVDVDLWLHGHLHCPSDYIVESEGGRRCRVVANPLGYVGNLEAQGFRPGLLIDVP